MGLIESLLAVYCLLVAVVLVVHVLRDAVPGPAVSGLVVLLELGLLVHLVVGLVQLGRPHPGVSVATYIGYLVAIPVLLPVAWLWSRGDQGRGGTAVLLGAMVVVPFLFLRVHQVWTARG